MGLLAAALWGFAEATLFFIVPDVLISAVAIRGTRAAYAASLFAAAGAVVGGSLMYFWGVHSPETAVGTVTAVPAVGAAMMERAHGELLTDGPISIILGPLSATPFKVYAVQAAAAGIPYWIFVLITPIARLPRFLLVAWLSGTVSRLIQPRVNVRTVYALWLAAWIVVYATLWRAMIF